MAKDAARPFNALFYRQYLESGPQHLPPYDFKKATMMVHDDTL